MIWSVLISFSGGVLQADFMKMPVADNTYDAVYTIEASCHAPDPVSIPSTFMPTYTMTILNFRSTFADEYRMLMYTDGFFVFCERRIYRLPATQRSRES